MINLVSKSPAETKILDYLNKNASEELINKINNGTPFIKDNKPFINKKTLSGFMKYANSEARKIVENGSNCACIEDDVVFGWAMHYFEEEAIEEKLYCLDGTPYVPPKKETSKTNNNSSNNFHPLPMKPPETKPQMSFFDMFNDKKQDTTLKDEISEEEVREAMEELEKEEQNTKVEEVKPTSPAYSNYLTIQEKYPNDIVVYRLGDFYEVFNENAKKIANILDLTITSREVGLAERIPMVGFPYHIADNYISKLTETGFTVVKAESPQDVKVIKPDTQKHWINDTTYVDEDGTVHEVSSSFDNSLVTTLKNIIGDVFVCAK